MGQFVVAKNSSFPVVAAAARARAAADVCVCVCIRDNKPIPFPKLNLARTRYNVYVCI